MRSRLVLAVYGAAALWLAVFVAYLVYLLLPFGVGLLSTLFAALVALALLVWLVRWLVWRPLRGGRVGRWQLATVLALAVATLTLDAAWTHYLVPLPPTDQDDCRFGSIGPEEFRALKRQMVAKFNADWEAASQSAEGEDEFGRTMADAVPKEASPEQLMAHIHALARSLGAELDSGSGGYQEDSHYWYYYQFDLNRTAVLRRILFRWARITFHLHEFAPGSNKLRLEAAVLLMPSLKGPEQRPASSRSCPPGPQPAGLLLDPQ
jgi:hypothetical protein